MKHFFLLLIVSSLFWACRKEKEPTADPPIILPEIPVYVPIFQPGDTSSGAAYAKKLTATWRAQAISVVLNSFDTNYISIEFFTYNSKGEIRETFGFGPIPRFEEPKTYGIKEMTKSTLQPDFVSPSYGTWKSDGDVLEDIYDLDTTAQDNFFKVEKIDLANKRMEGSFTVTFNIEEPRNNPINPKTVKFSNGKFWAVIQD